MADPKKQFKNNDGTNAFTPKSDSTETKPQPAKKAKSDEQNIFDVMAKLLEMMQEYVKSSAEKQKKSTHQKQTSPAPSLLETVILLIKLLKDLKQNNKMSLSQKSTLKDLVNFVIKEALNSHASPQVNGASRFKAGAQTKSNPQAKTAPKPQPEFNAYEVLGVKKEASAQEIQKAWKKQALQNHPDKHPGQEQKYTEKMQQVNRAFQEIGKPENKANYDTMHPAHGMSKQASAEKVNFKARAG